MMSLLRLAAASSSRWHCSDTTDSGVMTKMKALAARIPLAIRAHESAAGSMSVRSTHSRLSRALNAS